MGLEKVLDFLATTENVSVINILLVLNPKHSSYWEENQLYPRQIQVRREYLRTMLSTQELELLIQRVY